MVIAYTHVLVTHILLNQSLTKSPGFIAGVTNPTYEEHTSWWDVLCNISTGKITVSDNIEANHAFTTGRKQSIALSDEATIAAASAFTSLSLGRSASMSSHQYKQQQGMQSLSQLQLQQQQDVRDSDAEFMNEVMASIQAHYGETSIRAKFQDYVFRFVRLAGLYEKQMYGQTQIGWGSSETPLGYGPVFQDEASKQRELNANASRIEGWRQSISYKYYQRVKIKSTLFISGNIIDLSK